MVGQKRRTSQQDLPSSTFSTSWSTSISRNTNIRIYNTNLVCRFIHIKIGYFKNMVMCLPTIIILRKDIIILFVDMLFLHIDIIYLLLGINIYRKTSQECNAKIVLRSYTNATRVYLYDAFHFALLCRLPDSKQSLELLATSHYWSAGIGFNE